MQLLPLPCMHVILCRQFSSIFAKQVNPTCLFAQLTKDNRFSFAKRPIKAEQQGTRGRFEMRRNLFKGLVQRKDKLCGVFECFRHSTSSTCSFFGSSVLEADAALQGPHRLLDIQTLPVVQTSPGWPEMVWTTCLGCTASS